jgi:hypothetical protein
MTDELGWEVRWANSDKIKLLQERGAVMDGVFPLSLPVRFMRVANAGGYSSGDFWLAATCGRCQMTVAAYVGDWHGAGARLNLMAPEASEFPERIAQACHALLEHGWHENGTTCYPHPDKALGPRFLLAHMLCPRCAAKPSVVVAQTTNHGPAFCASEDEAAMVQAQYEALEAIGDPSAMPGYPANMPAATIEDEAARDRYADRLAAMIDSGHKKAEYRASCAGRLQGARQRRERKQSKDDTKE